MFKVHSLVFSFLSCSWFVRLNASKPVTILSPFIRLPDLNALNLFVIYLNKHGKPCGMYLSSLLYSYQVYTMSILMHTTNKLFPWSKSPALISPFVLFLRLCYFYFWYAFGNGISNASNILCWILNACMEGFEKMRDLQFKVSYKNNLKRFVRNFAY